jgi:hypothetical protein
MKYRLSIAALVFFVSIQTFCLYGYGETVSLKWYKGNTHTHTINSDGDSSPDAVARWYREHRYNFVVITDHNFLTDVRGLNSIFAAQGKFLVVSGEEVTDSYEGPDSVYSAIHLNAINLESVIPPAGGQSVVETAQNNVDAINAAGALCQLNHPNFHWSYTAAELDSVKNFRLMEIANYSSACNDMGGGGYSGSEALWDSLLTRGRRVYSVASDDAHNYKEFGPKFDNPGRGWVMVRCRELKVEDIVSALEGGDFYSSCGVVLDDIQYDSKSITLRMKEKRNLKYTVYFIGKGGKNLAVVNDNPATYRIEGREGYVRARVVDSEGKLAWTQPVFIK